MGVVTVSPYIKSIKSDSFVISGAVIWTASGVTSPSDIWVKDGIINKISTSAQPAPAGAIAANGLVVLPAGVDAQVHLRVPGQPHKETATTGMWAAVHGGVGALLTMPNTKPVIDEPSVCILARQELAPGEAATGVKVLLSAAITKGQRGKELVDFDGLHHAGVAAFTDDGVGVADDQVMATALRGVARTGLPLLQHAEVPGHGAVLAPGPIQLKTGGGAYNEDAETDMVARDLRLLEDTPSARYHVLHVSSAKTLDLVKIARRQGLKVTCEVSPHHLFFCSDDILEGNTSFKMNPPLRSPKDRELLQTSLANGDCQFMATDHAPHELESKSDNFKTSAFGTTGLETSLRVLLWMLKRGQLTPERLVQVWAKEPANFLGIDKEFGDIEVGRPFNAVLIDPDAPDRLVLESDFCGLSKNSCFVGSYLPGRIYGTYLRTWIHEIH